MAGSVNRRGVLGWGAGLAGIAAAPGVFAQGKKVLNVAAIYTVPVEQQWVSRIHKALSAAKDRGDDREHGKPGGDRAEYQDG